MRGGYGKVGKVRKGARRLLLKARTLGELGVHESGGEPERARSKGECQFAERLESEKLQLVSKNLFTQ